MPTKTRKHTLSLPTQDDTAAPSTLPEGWTSVRVGDAFRTWGGMTPPTAVPEYWNGSIPWISSKDVKSTVICDTVDHITQSALDKTRLRLCPKGTVVVVVRSGILAHTLPVAITDCEAVINQDIKAFTSGNRELDTWLSLAWRADAQRILEEGRQEGTTVQSVPHNVLKDYNLSVPPLAEQRRIVAAIDALTARVDAVRASLDRVPAILKRLRQSVLAAACSGRLTEEWREKNPPVETGDQLLRRILAERRVRWAAEGRRGRYVEAEPPDSSGLPELPAGWCYAPLRSITECLDSQRIPINAQERFKRIGDIPYYGANGQVGWIDKFLFDEPLVLVVEDETFIGRIKPFSYIIRGKAWVNNHAHVLRCLDNVSTEFLNIALSYYDFVPLTSGSTGRRKLNQEALMNALVPLPPISEQVKIVELASSLLGLCSKADRKLEVSKAIASRLSETVLSRAFRGELVPTEAELAWQESRTFESPVVPVLIENRFTTATNHTTKDRANGKLTRSARTPARVRDSV